MGFVKNCKTIRPLLSLGRFETGKLCSYWQLPIYPDKSNQKTIFLRNRIRKQIVPLIKLFFNLKIESVLLQLAEIVEAENQHMDQVANDLVSAPPLKTSLCKRTLLPLPTLVACQLLSLPSLHTLAVPPLACLTAKARGGTASVGKDDTKDGTIKNSVEIDIFSFLEDILKDKRFSNKLCIFLKKKYKGKIVRKHVVLRKEGGRITGFFETTQYLKIISTGNLLEREVRRLIDCTFLTPPNKLTSNLPLFTTFNDKVKRCYTPDANTDKNLEIFFFLRHSMPVGVNLWLWNKRLSKIKTLKEKAKDFVLYKKHTNDCKGKEKEFFLETTTPSLPFLEYSYGSSRNESDFNLDQAGLTENVLLGTAHFFLTAQLLPQQSFLPGPKGLLLPALPPVPPVPPKVVMVVMLVKMLVRSYTPQRAHKAGRTNIGIGNPSVWQACWKQLNRQSWKSIIVEDGITNRTKYPFFNGNSSIFQPTKPSLERRKKTKLVNLPSNLSYPFFEDREKNRINSKSSGKEKCFVSLNNSPALVISREKPREKHLGFYLDFFFLFQFFLYFNVFKAEKKDIYWPLILSSLPTVFQRRVGRLLLNQAWKETNYTQIEKFLAFQKTCKKIEKKR